MPNISGFESYLRDHKYSGFLEKFEISYLKFDREKAYIKTCKFSKKYLLMKLFFLSTQAIVSLVIHNRFTIFSDKILSFKDLLGKDKSIVIQPNNVYALLY